MLGKWIIYKTAAGYHFNLLSANRRIIATQPNVVQSMQECENSIFEVQKHANDNDIVVKMAKNGKFKLNLSHPDGTRKLLKSETYEKKAGAESGKKSVLKNIVSDVIEFQNLTDAPE